MEKISPTADKNNPPHVVTMKTRIRINAS
jgi:hypothetical protein